jgi:hypothetical protein
MFILAGKAVKVLLFLLFKMHWKAKVKTIKGISN